MGPFFAILDCQYPAKWQSDHRRRRGSSRSGIRNSSAINRTDMSKLNKTGVNPRVLTTELGGGLRVSSLCPASVMDQTTDLSTYALMASRSSSYTTLRSWKY